MKNAFIVFFVMLSFNIYGQAKLGVSAGPSYNWIRTNTESAGIDNQFGVGLNVHVVRNLIKDNLFLEGKLGYHLISGSAPVPVDLDPGPERDLLEIFSTNIHRIPISILLKYDLGFLALNAGVEANRLDVSIYQFHNASYIFGLEKEISPKLALQAQFSRDFQEIQHRQTEFGFTRLLLNIKYEIN